MYEMSSGNDSSERTASESWFLWQPHTTIAAMAESRSTAGLDPQSCKTVTYIKSNNSFFFFNCCFEFQTSTRGLKQRLKRLITSLTTLWMSGQSGFHCLHLQYCVSLKDRILTFVFNHAFSEKYRY